jgi:hypothetical protein
MIIGLPGAGKSFFARHFSDTFGAPLVTADQLRFELFEKSKYNQLENGLVKRLTDLQLTELVKTKSSILVDGICNSRTERQDLEQFAAQHNYGTLLVWVQTDEPTSKARATRRTAKRPGDEYNTSLTPEQFAAFTKRFVPPAKEDYVVISGKHTYTTQAKAVLRKLSAPRVEKAQEAHQQEATHLRVPVAQPRRNVIIR